MEWAQNAALYSLRGWRRTLCRNGYVRMSDNYQARPNSCLLFRENKEGNDKRPDYSGQIEIEGSGSFFAALWGRKDRIGNTYLALRLTKKHSKGVESQRSAEQFALPPKDSQ